jgi:L-asparaginase
MKKTKILLIFTGGTIAMVRDSKTNTLSPAKTPEQLLSIAPQLQFEFSTDIALIDNIDSTNIQTNHWVKIAECIFRNYDIYDGFVVSHGTDTMAYSASALSFSLQNLGKPVVFTGSQLPPDHINSDARNNLVNAFRVASMDIAEVLIVFGSEIIRGNRASKQSETDFNAFWSPIYPVLGKIRTEIDLYGDYRKRDDSKKLELKNKFDDEVFVLTIVPGFDPKFFEMLINSGVKGFVIAAFGAGNVPNKYKSLLKCIKLATLRNIPIIVSSQCLAGTAKMLIYEVGAAALQAGGISAGDMTLEAATTKLMWSLGQEKQLSKIKKLIGTNIIGELTVIT